jgi:purine nucleosidase/pyrimidine-specific ribonucleoside hydrolase
MDPGVDDALAIMLAMRSPEVEVKAITICGGNVGLDQCAANAQKTLEVLGYNPAPLVARGADRPVRRSPFRAGGIHGPDGLGNVLGDYPEEYPNPPAEDLDPRHAVDVILEEARSHPDAKDDRVPREETLTIVATAPLTNIALAISKDAEAMRRVGRIIWMGGAYATHGNITPVAEFNAFCDPDAAQEVLSFGIPMTVVGLDAAMQCSLSRQQLREVADTNETPSARFAWRICQMYMNFYRDHEGYDGCYLHDPLAVGLAIWPDLISRKELHHVEVVTEPGPTWGMTVIDRRPRNPWLNKVCREALDAMPPEQAQALRDFALMKPPPHVEVVLGVDGPEFVRRFLGRLCV